MYIYKDYYIKKINSYKALESFIEEANKKDYEIVNILKDEYCYIVIYKGLKEIGYEIR